MTTITTIPVPRIFVRSLANWEVSGWINATNDDLRGAIRSMFTASGENPDVDWAVHDYDHFHGIIIDEWPSLELVHNVATALVNATDRIALAMWLKHQDTLEGIEWATVEEDMIFYGVFRTESDFVDHWVKEQGEWKSLPDDKVSLTAEQYDEFWGILNQDHMFNALELSRGIWKVVVDASGYDGAESGLYIYGN